MKKILALGLVLIVLISAMTVPVLAEETAEEAVVEDGLLTEEEQLIVQNEFRIFDALGLSFDFSRAYSELTRAELARFAVELGGLVTTTDGETGYSDVPKRHWGFENINTAISNGFMTGKTEYLFKPTDIANVADGVRVMLGVLGYSQVAKDMGWSDSQCYMQAKRLGVFSGVSYELGEGLTPYIIAKLYMNCLDIEILSTYSIENGNVRYEEEDTQFITKRFGYRLESGVVYGVDDVAVLGHKIPGKGNIVIENSIYGSAGYDYMEYLGEKVNYIADSEYGDADCIYMEVSKDSDALVIDAENIESYEDYTLSYTDDDDNESVELSQSCRMIMNGTPKDTYDERDFMPYAGSLKLRDLDGDKKYDLVFITYIIYMQVNSAYQDSYLSDGFSGAQVKLDGSDITCVKDGRVVGFDNVTNGSVVGVMPDAITYTDEGYPLADNAKLKKVKLDLSCTMTEGQINVCASDWCTLDDTDYIYSKSFKKFAETYIDYPSVSTKAKVYTNADGLVVAIQSSSKFTSPGSGIKYGYLLGLQKKEGLSEGIKFKMVVDTATEQILESADSYYINDVKINDSDEIDTIQGLFAGGEVIQQLVAYKTDDNGNVKYFYTARDRINETVLDISGNEVANADLGDENYPGYDTEHFALNYSSSSEEYRASFGHRYMVSDEAVVFVLPAKRDETKLYKVTNKSYFTIGASYPISVFDVDENYNIYSMTVDSKLGNTGKINYSLWDGAVSYIITGKAQAYVDDEVKNVLKASSYGISSLSFTSYSEASLAAEQADMSDTDTYWTLYNGTKWEDLVPGDVIQIRKNEFGEVSGFRTVFRYKDLYNADGSVKYQSLDGRTAVDGSIYNTVGKVTKVLADGSLIYNIDPEGKSAGIHVAREQGMERSYNRGKIRVFIFDKAKQTVQTGSLKDVRLGDNVMVRSELGAACEMFVYR